MSILYVRVTCRFRVVAVCGDAMSRPSTSSHLVCLPEAVKYVLLTVVEAKVLSLVVNGYIGKGSPFITGMI